jgi:hypothetical protein
MREFIAYLAALLDGSANWDEMTTKAFQQGTGMTEKVDLTDGRERTSSAAAAVMRMKTAKIEVVASVEKWGFAICDSDVDIAGTAGEWTLPFLVMYAVRGLASWQLQAFLAAVTRIEDHNVRDFVLNAPCRTHFPASALSTLGTATDCVWQGFSRSCHGQVVHTKISRMCEYACSPAFSTTWDEGRLSLEFASDYILHEFTLPSMPLPILCALVWRELHMPE